jgi:hypothetical protein
MADREIRIPITVELQATGTAPKATTQTSTPQPTKKAETPKSSSGVGQAISAGLLIESSKKLLSATGNSQASQVIEKTVKYGTLAARSVTGDVTAMITFAVDLASEALMKYQELKNEAQVNNQTMYNKIKSGQVFLGNTDVYVTQDWLGNKTYNRR